MNSFVGSVFPGAVWAAFTERETIIRAYGNMSYAPHTPPMHGECVFDLASLTKVMATTMVLLSLAEEGAFDLEAPGRDFFPGASHSMVTVADLLRHRSGLPDYFPMDQIPVGQSRQDEEVVRALPKGYAPQETNYSCLGFLLSQTIAERLGGSNLELLFERRVAKPLGLTSTCFNPGKSLSKRIVPTEQRTEQRRTWELHTAQPVIEEEFVCGQVHDPVAFLRGGVSGNAGLFSTIHDVVRVGRCWLLDGQGVCSPARFREWSAPTAASDRGLGFDVAQPNGPVHVGGFKSGRAFGHNGFTGTSLWVDPDLKIGCALLSNRIHPTAEGPSMDLARSEAIRLALNAFPG